MNDDAAIAAVLDAERQRCEYLRLQNFAALREVLHPELIHVHTRGNQDSRESYLKFVTEVIQILEVKRENLVVKVFGDTAVMSGVQINTVRSRHADEVVTVKTQLLQVWLREETWQQVAFQATALGPLPPPAPRPASATPASPPPASPAR